LDTAPTVPIAPTALPDALRGLLDFSPDGVLLVNSAGAIQHSNAYITTLFGYTPEDLAGVPIAFLLPHSEDALAEVRPPHHALADGLAVRTTYGYWVQNAEGSTFAVDVTLSVVKAGADGLVCLAVRDASTRKAAEQAQQVSISKLERVQAQILGLSHTLPLAIFQYESGATGGGRYSFVSERVAEVLGVTAAQMLEAENCWMGMLAQTDRERWTTELAQVLASGQVALEIDVPIPVRGGIRWVHVAMAFAGQKVDERLLWNGYFEDVTAQKEAALRMLEAKDLAESASRMKSDFLANMSHEIRTPMNAILGLSYLLLQSELASKQRDYLQKIQSSGQHLLGIINDILDFSKVEAGKLTLECSDFSLSQTLDGLLNMVEAKAVDKGLALVIDIDPLVPDQLQGDALRLGQILINYANNAIKFTERGTVKMAVRCIEDTGSAVLLRFDVSDTGIGLTPEQMQRLFRNFEQADTSTTRKYGGTGLGLAICKSLAQLMQGETGVESVLGQGSVFWFTARLGKGAAALPPSLPAPDLRGKQVLVVDDRLDACAILRSMLENMTFQVEVAHSGAMTIEAVQRKRAAGAGFDIVFLDWQMPQMDGLETAKRIQALDLHPIPQVLMVTAHGREEVLHGARALGIEHVLIKPVNPSMLFDTTMQLLHQQEPSARRAPPAEQSLHQEVRLRAGARILLVEDNELNQLVACELLAGVGLQVEVADNGQVAVDRVLAQPDAWDLVLMDMQMPVLDGVGATQLLRQTIGPERLVIVAMTANAMQQDRDKCLEAGMQDYVAKPIDPDALWRMLVKWLPARRPTAPPVGVIDVSGPTRAAIDIQALVVPGLDSALGLKRVLGNASTFVRLLHRFVAGQTGAVEHAQQALDAGDHALAERLVHTLKGVAGNIGATEIQAQAEEVESRIHARAAQATIRPPLAQLGRTLAAFLQALRARLLDFPEAESDKVDPRHATAALHQLREAVLESDANAGELFDQYKSMLRALAPDDFHTLEAAMTDFDYDIAGHCLAALLLRIEN
jgi:two-component system sensor histidine kinase/response regulator